LEKVFVGQNWCVHVCVCVSVWLSVSEFVIECDWMCVSVCDEKGSSDI
jgi:hypothetical protein